MNVIIKATPEELGMAAAQKCAELIAALLKQKETVRMVLSTGASQFTTFDALLKQDIDWSRVELFHLDEYIGLPITHKASFRKYLNERFFGKINARSACLVNGEGDVEAELQRLEQEISRAPLDIGLIGIGENAHIAFNDPPADFDAAGHYKVVQLSESCKRQQVGEGWFESVEAVPVEAISMTVQGIMGIRNIISCVPGSVKAQAVYDTLNNPVTNQVPATILTTHPSFTLVLDAQSARLLQQGTRLA